MAQYRLQTARVMVGQGSDARVLSVGVIPLGSEPVPKPPFFVEHQNGTRYQVIRVAAHASGKDLGFTLDPPAESVPKDGVLTVVS